MRLTATSSTTGWRFESALALERIREQTVVRRHLLEVVRDDGWRLGYIVAAGTGGQDQSCSPHDQRLAEHLVQDAAIEA
jgi:hypothetical protein